MLATHCDKCGKILLMGDKGPHYKQMNEAGWCKVYVHGDHDSTLDLCKECFDDLQAAVRKEIE